MGSFLSRSRPAKSYIVRLPTPAQRDVRNVCVLLGRAEVCLKDELEGCRRYSSAPLALLQITMCIDKVQGYLDCPTKPKPPGFDEAALNSLMSKLKSIVSAINKKDYIGAKNLAICLQRIIWWRPIEDDPSAAVDEEVITAIVAKIHLAHIYAKRSMFSVAANVIIRVLETPVSDEDFIEAAIKNHLASKRTWRQEVKYRERNAAVYKEVSKLRRSDKMIWSVFSHCKDAERHLHTAWSGGAPPRRVRINIRELDSQSCLESDDEN